MQFKIWNSLKKKIVVIDVTNDVPTTPPAERSPEAVAAAAAAYFHTNTPSGGDLASNYCPVTPTGRQPGIY